MTRAALEGEDLSIYFWGQKYGMTLFEILATIPFFLAMGYTTLAAKFGGFTLWVTGTVYLYKAMAAMTKNQAMALGITMLFIMFPAWIVWSMKACGGYTSAFMFSNILLYLLFDEKRRHNTIYFITIGTLLVLIYECQRLWLAGTLPFVVYSLWKEEKRIKILYTAAAGLLLYAILFFYKKNIDITYAPPTSLPDLHNISWYISRFPGYLYRSFQGNYYFSIYQSPWVMNGVLAAMGVVLLLGLIPFTIYRMIQSPKQNMLLLVSVLFIPLCLGYTFLSYAQEGRYLLPVSGFLAISLCIAFSHLKRNVFTKAAYGLIAITGIGSSICFYNFFEHNPKYKSDLLSTIKYLEDNKVYHTYCTECMMPFQLMYYSDMKILSRMPYQPARYQPHSDAVDSVLFNKGKVAVIVFKDLTLDMNLPYQYNTENTHVSVSPNAHEIFKAYFFHHPEKK